MIENINVGAQANDHTGDKLRNAFIKVNDNFDYIQSILDTCLIQGSVEISDINGLQLALDNIQLELDNIPLLQDQINSLSSSISYINNAINTINNDISNIQASILDIYSSISDISNSISQVQNDILDIQNELLNKVDEAPEDGESYIRKDGEWINVNNYAPSLKKVVEDGGDNTITDGSIVQFSNSGFTTSINEVQFRASLITGQYTEVSPGVIRLRSIGAAGDAYIRNGGTANNVNFYLPAKSTGGYTFSTIDDLSNYVPYVGATKNVDLGIYGLTATSLQFTGLTNSGRLTWNDQDGTVDLGLKGGNVTLQIGQESVIRVVNKTATNIDLLESNYQAVRVTGAQGNRLKVDLAQATTDILSAETIGLVTETILNNQEGFITTSGLVRNINTTGSLQGETWVDGDMLYLSPTVAGQLTNVKPSAPNHLVIIGYVVRAHATQGQIFVKVDNGYELDELHNVLISGTPSNGEVLTYDSVTNIWKNEKPLNDLQIRRTGITIFDDMTTTGNGVSPFIKNSFNSGLIQVNIGISANHQGIVGVASTTSASNGGGSILMANVATARNMTITPNIQFDIVMFSNAFSNNVFYRFGFISGTVNPTDVADGFYFEWNGANLVAKTASGSVRSSSSTYTMTSGAWYHLRIKMTSASLITYEVYNDNGDLLFNTTLSTNIPAVGTGTQPGFIGFNQTAENKTMCVIDYISATYPAMNRGALT